MVGRWKFLWKWSLFRGHVNFRWGVFKMGESTINLYHHVSHWFPWSVWGRWLQCIHTLCLESVSHPQVPLAFFQTKTWKFCSQRSTATTTTLFLGGRDLSLKLQHFYFPNQHVIIQSLFWRKGLDLRCSQSDLSLDLQKKLQEAQIGSDVIQAIQGSHYLKGGDGIAGYWENQTMLIFSNILFMFTPTWENDPIWQAYFSDGLVQPPPRHG